MQTEALSVANRRQDLENLLLSSLFRLSWPGADGLTIDDVLLSYPAAAARRQVPAYPKLLRNHPELSQELEAFFSAPDRWLAERYSSPEQQRQDAGPRYQAAS